MPKGIYRREVVVYTYTLSLTLASGPAIEATEYQELLDEISRLLQATPGVNVIGSSASSSPGFRLSLHYSCGDSEGQQTQLSKLLNGYLVGQLGHITAAQ